MERLAWGLGIVLVVAYGAVRVHGTILKQRELDRFAEARQAVEKSRLAGTAAGRAAALHAQVPVDFSLWSDNRIRAYEASREQHIGAPLAVLRIPKFRIEVPVLEGTEDVVLDRGVGHIAGTARPGDSGNIGIAGHRDGFFRGLKGIAEGYVIELETLYGTETYLVDTLTIVDPGAVEVLEQTEEPSITLVTCYPFYFVGAAPQRFIVRAVRASGPVEAGT